MPGENEHFDFIYPKDNRESLEALFVILRFITSLVYNYEKSSINYKNLTIH